MYIFVCLCSTFVDFFVIKSHYVKKEKKKKIGHDRGGIGARYDQDAQDALYAR